MYENSGGSHILRSQKLPLDVTASLDERFFDFLSCVEHKEQLGVAWKRSNLGVFQFLFLSTSLSRTI